MKYDPFNAHKYRMLNPRNEAGQTLLKAHGKRAAFVIVHRDQPGGGVPAGYTGDRESAEWHDDLDDPAFEVCSGGIIYSDEDGSECICVRTGNPPPPTMPVPCPQCVERVRDAARKKD